MSRVEQGELRPHHKVVGSELIQQHQHLRQQLRRNNREKERLDESRQRKRA